MDGYTSAEGNAQSRLQWSFVPCKPLPTTNADNKNLCDSNPNYNVSVNPVQVAAQERCGSRGGNPYLSCPTTGTGSLEAAMQNYIPGQPLGRTVGAPFKSTECNPVLVSATIPGPRPVQTCDTMGCQVVYDNKVKCDRWTGPVNRYFNYPCQCPAGPLVNGYMGAGSCAGSGTSNGCCGETCPVPNYRQMLKSNYPFC